MPAMPAIRCERSTRILHHGAAFQKTAKGMPGTSGQRGFHTAKYLRPSPRHGNMITDGRYTGKVRKWQVVSRTSYAALGGCFFGTVIFGSSFAAFFSPVIRGSR